jgi:sterol desaturase/sphingolipid hydroxylase (fatty acid hydroxylase superfamily)
MPNPIVLAVPLFICLLLLELGWSLWRQRSTFAFGDTLANLSLGLSGQVLNVFAKAASLGVYVLAYEYLALFQLPTSAWWVWVLGIIGYDFLYYWNHRLGHEVNLLWASHVVHHSSEEYNLSTALRQTSTGFFTSWLFYWPLAVLGVPPVVFLVSGAISLLYQFWIHTRLIGSLGWFDRWFASPSNHRVHHGQNAYCVDRNYGAILMLWDHLFGSFAAERSAHEEPIVYGIHGQLKRYDLLHANLHKYADLLADARLADNWKDRIRVWFARPGWRPRAAELHDPKPAYDLAAFRIYRPQITRSAALFSLLQLVVVLLAGMPFITYGADLPRAWQIVAAGWLLTSLWVICHTLEGHANARSWQLGWLLSLPLPVALGHFFLGLQLPSLVPPSAVVALLFAGLLLSSRPATPALDS